MGKYRERYPKRHDAKVVTGRDRQGWYLHIHYGLEYDYRGRKSWNKSHLVDSMDSQQAALDEVLEMFDYAENGFWTPLSNMDDSDDDEEEDDGLGGITQGMGRMGNGW
jgi:hypothetical protein